MTIKFKRSIDKGFKPTPAELQEGELAIGLVDKSLFTKDHKGEIIKLGGAGGVSDGDLVATLKTEDDDFWYIPFGMSIAYDSAPPTIKKYLPHRIDFGISTVPRGADAQEFYVNPVTGKGYLEQRTAASTSGSSKLFYTTDWGRSWTASTGTGAQTKYYNYWGIRLVNPSGTKMSIRGYGTNYGLSTDGGKTWNKVTGGTANAKVDKSGWWNSMMFYGDNRRFGASFRSAMAFDDNRAIAVADAGNSPNKAYIFYTTDFGKTWKSAADAPWVNIQSVAVQVGGTVGYIAGQGQLIKTTNSGQTWTAVTTLPTFHKVTSYLRIGCTKSGRLFLCYVDNNTDMIIYHSDDQGATWKINTFYEDHTGSTTSMLNFTTDDNRVAFGGIVSFDNGETWERNILMDNTNGFNGYFVPGGQGKRVYADLKNSGSYVANLFVQGKYQNYGNGWYSYTYGGDSSRRLALAKSV